MPWVRFLLRIRMAGLQPVSATGLSVFFSPTCGTLMHVVPAAVRGSSSADRHACPPPSCHAAVRNRLEKKSMNNILIRLRQACMHPYLLPGQEPEVHRVDNVVQSAAVLSELLSMLRGF